MPPGGEGGGDVEFGNPLLGPNQSSSVSPVPERVGGKATVCGWDSWPLPWGGDLLALTPSIMTGVQGPHPPPYSTPISLDPFLSLFQACPVLMASFRHETIWEIPYSGRLLLENPKRKTQSPSQIWEEQTWALST